MSFLLDPISETDGKMGGVESCKTSSGSSKTGYAYIHMAGLIPPINGRKDNIFLQTRGDLRDKCVNCSKLCYKQQSSQLYNPSDRGHQGIFSAQDAVSL